jgi:hypothetical protein
MNLDIKMLKCSGCFGLPSATYLCNENVKTLN